MQRRAPLYIPVSHSDSQFRFAIHVLSQLGRAGRRRALYIDSSITRVFSMQIFLSHVSSLFPFAILVHSELRWAATCAFTYSCITLVFSMQIFLSHVSSLFPFAILVLLGGDVRSVDHTHIPFPFSIHVDLDSCLALRFPIPICYSCPYSTAHAGRQIPNLEAIYLRATSCLPR